MRHVWLPILMLAAAPLLPQALTPQQLANKAKAQNVPEMAYESVPNFLKFPPNVHLGEAMGVATNSKGHIFVFSRIQDTRLFEFDERGNWVKEWGKGLYGFQFAHTVRVDRDDNVWVVDEGTNMVIKFNPQGRVAMVIGKRPEWSDGLFAPATTPGTPPDDPYLFCRPTDVTFDPQGNIYVADGYCNSRIVKYSKDGRFIKSVGTRGNGPDQFNTPHGITADNQGNVYVADRQNGRIKVYDGDLTLKKMYDQVGNPWTVCVSGGPHQYLYSSNSNPDNNNSQIMAVTGEIYKMELDGTILAKFGKPGKQLGEFSTVHEIDCRNENQITVSEITAWRVQRLNLKPAGGASAKK